MQSAFDELFAAMQQRQGQVQQGAVPPAHALELARQELRHAAGCPDDEALGGFVDGQLSRTSPGRWLRVWLHVRLRRCRYCQEDVGSLGMVPQPAEALLPRITTRSQRRGGAMIHEQNVGWFDTLSQTGGQMRVRRPWRQVTLVLTGFLVASGLILALLRTQLFDVSTRVYSLVDFLLLAALLPLFVRDYRDCLAGSSRVQELVASAQDFAQRLFDARVQGRLSHRTIIALMRADPLASQEDAAQAVGGAFPKEALVATRVFDALVPAQEAQEKGEEKLTAWFTSLRVLPEYAGFALALGLLGTLLGLLKVADSGSLYVTITGVKEALGSSIAGLIAAWLATSLSWELARRARQFAAHTDNLIRSVRLHYPDPADPSTVVPTLIEAVTREIGPQIGTTVAACLTPVTQDFTAAARRLDTQLAHLSAQQPALQERIKELAGASEQVQTAVTRLVAQRQQTEDTLKALQGAVTDLGEGASHIGVALEGIEERLAVNDDVRVRQLSLLQEVVQSMQATAAVLTTAAVRVEAGVTTRIEEEVERKVKEEVAHRMKAALAQPRAPWWPRRSS